MLNILFDHYCEWKYYLNDQILRTFYNMEKMSLKNLFVLKPMVKILYNLVLNI